MRHRVYGRKLGRNKNQRTALFKGLVRDLLIHESIITTEPKAKAIKGLVDKIISSGKTGTESAKRKVKSFLVQEEVIKKLLEDIAPRYKQKVSGFTTAVRLGTRKGDGAMLVKMSLLGDLAVGSVDNQGEVKETKQLERKKKK